MVGQSDVLRITSADSLPVPLAGPVTAKVGRFGTPRPDCFHSFDAANLTTIRSR
ncbi:hypothetical protein [Nocardia neocaledoniensis]|uniref:hypothetical protein n=1 Tax=Nocardia neocaledoniensis TaxID=236511 RepID=UPI002454E555|nr:hypothetical protein [Nocardia neocaledoniensis]